MYEGRRLEEVARMRGQEPVDALFDNGRRGRVLRGDIHHTPWRLQSAEAQITRNTLPKSYGITLPDPDPVLHYSERQDSLIWAPELDG